MATSMQLVANKKNALVSTGPRTAEGKSIVAKNAVRHGLTAAAPVIAGLESEEDWRHFREGLLADLDPQGCLEEALAERVALSFWRLQRVARYEAAVIDIGQEDVGDRFKRLREKLKVGIEKRDIAHGRAEASKQKIAFVRSLPNLVDDAKVEGADVFELFETIWNLTAGRLPAPAPGFAKAMGLPPEAHKDTWEWAGWTAGLVRQVVKKLAVKVKASPEDLFAHCQGWDAEIEHQHQERFRENQDLVEDLTCRLRNAESRLRRKRVLPDEATLAKIAKYEGHLGKQMSQALHELQRIQESRRGGFVPPPTVVDVNINRNADVVE